MYGSVHYLDIIAPRFNDELLKKLLDIDDNLTITMHMQTMDPVKAIKMLKGALTNIQKMKIEEQKKAVRSGYDMDILPTDIITYEKDTLELLDDLNTSNQKIIKMTFLITCYGRSKRELENITQRVSGIIQQANYHKEYRYSCAVLYAGIIYACTGNLLWFKCPVKQHDHGRQKAASYTKRSNFRNTGQW